MPNSSSFSEFLSSVALRGRAIVGLGSKEKHALSSGAIVDLCHQLLSSKGEASGIALSNEILTRYAVMDEAEKTKFFIALNKEFSANITKIETAARQFLDDPCGKNIVRLSDAAEPSRRQLIIRLNLAPNATQLLINMRADLLERISTNPDLNDVDKDFAKLFSSWFNGGFLQLSKINWTSPALLLEKVIQYEAVHGMAGWDDLKDRIAPPDRLIYGFFHPRLNGEPLIFIEIALTKEMPSKISGILSHTRTFVDPQNADTAVFYSISNCQKGLRGIPLGSFLIKQVVEDLKHSFPSLKEFVTLSPIPGFAGWLRSLNDETSMNEFQLSQEAGKLLTKLDARGWLNRSEPNAELSDELTSFVLSAIAYYLSQEKNKRAQPINSVAKFHLGNGARLERINWSADLSEQGLNNAYGAMVNYRYRIDEIEQNHEKFAENGAVTISPETSRWAKSFDKYIVKKAAKSDQ